MRRLLRPLLALVLVLAIGAAVLWGWTAWKSRQLRDVAIPDDDTPPAEVVAAYVDALDAHDCDTAAALFSRHESWCGDVDSITLDGVPRPKGAAGSRRHVEAVAQLEVSWLPFHSGGDIGSGRIEWIFTLERADRDAPWRIVAQSHA